MTTTPSLSDDLPPIQRVCVFCGSSRGVNPEYARTAEALGAGLVTRGWGLVYGGGSVGLMGAIADSVLFRQGEVIGVIPQMLATRELLHPGVNPMHVVPSMHARKALMADLASAFVALPGGFGTFEEILEVITWSQLGIHRKPIGLLNVQEFFTPLVAFIDRAVEHGFIRAEQRQLFIVANEPEDLLAQLAAHRPPPARRWLNPAQT